MRVIVNELNKVEFQVKFRRRLVKLDKSQTEGYQFKLVMSDKDQVASIATECRIFIMPAHEECASGITVCDTRDHFSKSVGRRAAFTKALKLLECSNKILELSQRITERLRVEPLRWKEIRQEFWKAYFASMDKSLVTEHVEG